MTQAQLAEAADVGQGTISRIERGSTEVSLTMILRLAAALDVPPAQLFELPELHARVLSALEQADPQRRAEALQVLDLFLKAPSPGA